MTLGMTEGVTPVDRALEVIRAGGLVAIPTETVYGLAADASNPDAVRRIFAAKGRPADHPLIVHVATAEHLADWAREVPASAARLAATCWPGPLTLLVPKADHVLSIVTGGHDAVGVRVPAHPLTTELLERFSGGLAAPSANRFGKVSPTTAEHVRADLGDLVDYVLDGGPCPVGVESTIVDCTIDPPQVLRPGGIPNEDIAVLLEGALAAASGPSRASGMLHSHYAPSCPVLLVDDMRELHHVTAAHPGCAIVGVGVDLPTYARGLYEWLRAADRERRPAVVALLPRPQGLGHAIRDRLQKAAAPRR
jgi:L-threonylcarbamoyladenylate synthase